MSFNFTGASRTSRLVALGGQSSQGVDPATKARIQRQERERHRKLSEAATRIQSQVRRIAQAQHERAQLREHAHSLLATLNTKLATGGSVNFDDLVSATRSTIISLGPHTRKIGEPDVQLFLDWIRVVSRQLNALPILFRPLIQDATTRGDAMVVSSTPLAKGWLSLLRLVCKLALRLLATRGATEDAGLQTQADLQIFHLLSLLTGAQTNSPADKIILEAGTTLSFCLLEYLLRNDLHRALRDHILRFPPQQKGSVPTLPPAVHLALAPFHAFKYTPALSTSSKPSKQDAMQIDQDSTSGNQSSSLREQAVGSFANHILTTPWLRKRLPLASVTELAKHLPFEDLLDFILQAKATHNGTHSAASTTRSALASPHFLANLLAFGSQRVNFIKSGPALVKYLDALTIAQDSLPLFVFYPPSQNIALNAEDDLLAEEAQAMPSATGTEHDNSDQFIDQETYDRLSILVSGSHISSILSISVKFPSSTRGALFAFITSVLSTWPDDVQSQVLDRLLFFEANRTAPAATHAAPSRAGPAGTGLIREFWRGYLRGSQLIRIIASAQPNTKAREILSTLTEAQFGKDWPALILLFDMLSKILLTIGDDEFFPDRDGSPRSSSSSSGSAGNHAWLSSEEILSISGLLRNLAFAMYWHEGKAPLDHLRLESEEDAQDAGVARVPGTRMSLMALRSLVTKVVQQLHARDSRRKYAPPDFWLMVSHLDLNDFVKTVVMEEEQLNKEPEAEEAAPTNLVPAYTQILHPRARRIAFEEYMRDPSSAPMAERRLLRNSSTRETQQIKDHRMAFLSPRLGILNNVPFLIPFEIRVQIFRQFVRIDADKHGIYRDAFQRRQSVKIRRSHVAQDGFASLNPIGAKLKQPLEIIFIDQFGQVEAGIDGGGLFKEFLTSLVKEAFDTNRGLWLASDNQELYPNPHSYATSKEQLEWFTFLGRVIGKALYEGILVDVKFAGFFLSKMLGKQSYLDDLGSIDTLDKELYRGLVYLKNYQGDVEDLSLNFTVTDEEFGVSTTRELVPGGANIPVTNVNKMQYIYRISHYRLTTQIAAQCKAFFRGLSDMINPRWLRSFNREELSILISGTEDPIDVEDLKKNTILAGYHEKDLTIQYFWDALESFDQPLRKAFLKFVTSSPNPPLLGFRQLNPQFAIRNAGNDTTRLPTASTCVNLLKLPDYGDKQTCRDKLLYALQSDAGFDLS